MRAPPGGFAFRITEEALGRFVPISYVSAGGGHDDRILRVFHHAAELSLGFAQRRDRALQTRSMPADDLRINNDCGSRSSPQSNSSRELAETMAARRTAAAAPIDAIERRRWLGQATRALRRLNRF